jgi:hypothetical protein
LNKLINYELKNINDLNDQPNRNKIKSSYLLEFCNILNIEPFRIYKNKIEWNTNNGLSESKIKELLESYLEIYLKDKKNKLKLKNKYPNINFDNIEELENIKEKIKINIYQNIYEFKNSYNNKIKNNNIEGSLNHFYRTNLNEEHQEELSKNRNQKGYIYDNIKFHSEFEAQKYRNVILPLIKELGINVELQVNYNDYLNMDNDHSIDFNFPELGIIIESTSFTELTNYKGNENHGQEYKLGLMLKDLFINIRNSYKNEETKIFILSKKEKGNIDFTFDKEDNIENVNEFEMKKKLIEIIKLKKIKEYKDLKSEGLMTEEKKKEFEKFKEKLLNFEKEYLNESINKEKIPKEFITFKDYKKPKNIIISKLNLKEIYDIKKDDKIFTTQELEKIKQELKQKYLKVINKMKNMKLSEEGFLQEHKTLEKIKLIFSSDSLFNELLKIKIKIASEQIPEEKQKEIYISTLNKLKLFFKLEKTERSLFHSIISIIDLDKVFENTKKLSLIKKDYFDKNFDKNESKEISEEDKEKRINRSENIYEEIELIT